MQNKKLLLFLFLLFISSTLVCSINTSKEKRYGEEPSLAVFKDKNLVTFGNSITAANNSWAYQVYERLGFGNLYNGAVGGAVWSKRIRKTVTGKQIITQDYHDPHFAGISNGYSADPDDSEYQKRINNCAIVHIQKYLSLKEIEPTPDYIILSYGTNDVLGKEERDREAMPERKIEDADLFSMAEGIRWCIETLKAEFPKAKLYIVFPLQAKDFNRNVGNLKKIEIMKAICEKLSVTYFNSYAESGITQENQSSFLSDGLHPNKQGQAKHGDYIVRRMKEAEGL